MFHQRVAECKLADTARHHVYQNALVGNHFGRRFEQFGFHQYGCLDLGPERFERAAEKLAIAIPCVDRAPHYSVASHSLLANHIRSQSSTMQKEQSRGDRTHGRFTNRLEAFSDLVFGFSLSLLATRLEVPSTPEGILDKSKGAALLITFAFICVMWLQHYRIFRYHFVARPLPVVMNFLFLFGLALLPYALQTFIRFQVEPAALCLYLGDLALIFVCLATLQLSGLLQRDPEMDDSVRLREWRRSVSQYLIVLIMLASIVIVATGGIGRRVPGEVFAGIILFIAIGTRRFIRRVPSFLEPNRVRGSAI